MYSMWDQSHLTSSVISFLGGLNSSWYDLPLGLWMSLPVMRRTSRLSSIPNSTTESSLRWRSSSNMSNFKHNTTLQTCQAFVNGQKLFIQPFELVRPCEGNHREGIRCDTRKSWGCCQWAQRRVRQKPAKNTIRRKCMNTKPSPRFSYKFAFVNCFLHTESQLTASWYHSSEHIT